MVSRRRDGNRVYYRIADEGVLALCEQVCGSVRRDLEELDELFGQS
jgi:DNA-binding transcriptional ArsR family regulator